MPWLADTDVGAAHGFARALVEARTEAELRRRALQALAELVPADVLTWDRVELATGAVRHQAVPAEAEPPGAFGVFVGDAADHPLLAAHAARRRPALRIWAYRERARYLSTSRAAFPHAFVRSRMKFACVVASLETHSTSLEPGPRSRDSAIAFRVDS